MLSIAKKYLISKFDYELMLQANFKSKCEFEILLFPRLTTIILQYELFLLAEKISGHSIPKVIRRHYTN